MGASSLLFLDSLTRSKAAENAGCVGGGPEPAPGMNRGQPLSPGFLDSRFRGNDE